MRHMDRSQTEPPRANEAQSCLRIGSGLRGESYPATFLERFEVSDLHSAKRARASIDLDVSVCLYYFSHTCTPAGKSYFRLIRLGSWTMLWFGPDREGVECHDQIRSNELRAVARVEFSWHVLL